MTTFLTLDLGGSHAASSLVRGQDILATEHLAFADTTQLHPLLPEITASLKKLAATAEGPIEGLGIGVCALVDSRRNTVLSTNGKYEDSVAFDFAQWGRDSLGIPVRLENDARLALRGEMYAGAARGVGDVVMFTLGTGIGGVAAMNGAPLIGTHGQAGVLGGHVPVRENGRACTCGGRGCAEAEASGWSLPMVCNEWPGFAGSRLSQMPLNFKSLFDLSAAGDKTSIEIRNHCLNIWGMMSVAAVHSFDPALIVFGGGAMGAADQILSPLREYVHHNTWTPWGKPPIVAAQLGERAAALGVPTLFTKEDFGHV